MNYLPVDESDRVKSVIAKAGLPTTIDAAFSTDEVIRRFRADKKKKDDVIHFVLIKKIGMPFVNGSINEQQIGDVLEEMKA
jgi:3-dehydroquinate synthetase